MMILHITSLEPLEKPRHATPISRPVFMHLRKFNLTPMIDARFR